MLDDRRGSRIRPLPDLVVPPGPDEVVNRGRPAACPGTADDKRSVDEDRAQLETVQVCSRVRAQLPSRPQCDWSKAACRWAFWSHVAEEVPRAIDGLLVQQRGALALELLPDSSQFGELRARGQRRVVVRKHVRPQHTDDDRGGKEDRLDAAAGLEGGCGT